MKLAAALAGDRDWKIPAIRKDVQRAHADLRLLRSRPTRLAALAGLPNLDKK